MLVFKTSAQPPRQSHPYGRGGEDRTHDVLAPNQARYHCATPLWRSGQESNLHTRERGGLAGRCLTVRLPLRECQILGEVLGEDDGELEGSPTERLKMSLPTL